MRNRAITDGGFFEGQEAAISHHISERDVQEFVALSGDNAPLHLDPAFAQKHGFAGAVVHGALLAAAVSKLVGTVLPGSNAILERMDLSFRNPVFAPVDLKVTGRIRHISEAVQSLTLDITINDSSGATAVTGKTWHRILGSTVNSGEQTA